MGTDSPILLGIRAFGRAALVFVATVGVDAAAGSFNFAHEISPILAKTGCAAAECHGAATGQGGFKLSLFAGDPRADHESIRNELDGRRVDLLRPENSLFLRKPLRELKHGGGRIFREGDENFRALFDWIKAGAPYESGAREVLRGIDLSIESGRAKVIASFESETGLSKRDVTRLSLLSSTRETVARIDDAGLIRMTGQGESWILARFGEFSARAPTVRPFGRGAFGASQDADNPLDRAWLARMNELGLKPAPAADWNTLLRRLYLDLVGRPPAPHEAQAFFAMPAGARVARVAEKLTRSEEFSEVFGGHVARWFEIPEASGDDRNSARRNAALRRFFRQAVGDRLSLFDIARRTLTERGPDQAWRHLSDPRDRAEYFGRAMLGMSIACARCHNHPLDRWRREEHLRFSAHFVDPRPAPGGGMMVGRFFLPGEGRPVQPALLPIAASAPPPGQSLERRMAWFATEGAVDQFARNFGNRIFGVLMGRSLIEEEDDHRLSNPAAHESLLTVLAREFQKSGGDLRAIALLVAMSRPYALASDPPSPGEFKGDPKLEYLARREARPLSPSQFKRAVEAVLGVRIDRPAPPDSPLARQLHVMNSGLLQAGLNAPGNQVEAIFDFQSEPGEQLRELFQLILSRPSTERETEVLLPALRGARDRRAFGKDLAFALLASREFGSLR